jgi:uncharacterized protein YciI
MKHFMIEMTYLVPFKDIEKILKEHREFLDIGYQKDLLLCSGPQNPRIGGIVFAKANDKDEIIEFFSKDPLQTEKFAKYRYVEFNPVKFNPILKEWIEK